MTYKVKPTVYLSAIFGLLLLLLVACGGSGTSPAGVSIDPRQATLAPGASRSFTATVTGLGATSVTWEATGGTVSGNGNTVTYTAPSEAGDYSLTARSQVDSRHTATATITVTSETASDGPTTTLHVTPSAVTFTGIGQSKILVVKAYNQEGQEVALPSDLVWRNGDSSSIELTVDPTNPDRATVMARTDLGSSLVAAVAASDPNLVSGPVAVTTADVKSGVVLVEDEHVVFPLLDPESNQAAPDIRDEGDSTIIASFSHTEVLSLYELVDDATLRYPVVLREGSAQVGDSVLGVGGAPILGRVTSAETRGGFTLLQVEQGVLEDIFDAFTFNLDAEELVAQGVLAPASHSFAPQGVELLAGVKWQLDKGRCDGGVSLDFIESVVPENVSIQPSLKAVIDTGTRYYEVLGKLSGGFDLTVRLKVGVDMSADVKCYLTAPYTIPFPPVAGPASYILNGGIDVAPVLALKVDFKSGLGAELSATAGGHGFAQAGFRCVSGACEDLSTAEWKWAAKVVADSDLSSSLDNVPASITATVGLHIEEDLKLTFGLPVLDGVCNLNKWSRTLAWVTDIEKLCQDLRGQFQFSIAVAKQGGEATAVWESSKKVVQSHDSDSIAYHQLVANLKVGSGINRVLKYLRLKALEESLIEISAFPGYWYRPYEHVSMTVSSPSFTGAIGNGTSLTVAVGDQIAVSVRGAPKLVPRSLRSDLLTQGAVWHSWTSAGDQDEELVADATVSVEGDVITARLTITDEMCKRTAPSLHFLGYNKMFGVLATAGYLGSVKLDCKLWYLVRSPEEGPYTKRTSTVPGSATTEFLGEWPFAEDLYALSEVFPLSPQDAAGWNSTAQFDQARITPNMQGIGIEFSGSRTATQGLTTDVRNYYLHLSRQTAVVRDLNLLENSTVHYGVRGDFGHSTSRRIEENASAGTTTFGVLRMRLTVFQGQQVIYQEEVGSSSWSYDPGLPQQNSFTLPPGQYRIHLFVQPLAATEVTCYFDKDKASGCPSVGSSSSPFFYGAWFEVVPDE